MEYSKIKKVVQSLIQILDSQNIDIVILNNRAYKLYRYLLQNKKMENPEKKEIYHLEHIDIENMKDLQEKQVIIFLDVFGDDMRVFETYIRLIEHQAKTEVFAVYLEHIISEKSFTHTLERLEIIYEQCSLNKTKEQKDTTIAYFMNNVFNHFLKWQTAQKKNEFLVEQQHYFQNFLEPYSGLCIKAENSFSEQELKRFYETKLPFWTYIKNRVDTLWKLPNKNFDFFQYSYGPLVYSESYIKDVFILCSYIDNPKTDERTMQFSPVVILDFINLESLLVVHERLFKDTKHQEEIHDKIKTIISKDFSLQDLEDRNVLIQLRQHSKLIKEIYQAIEMACLVYFSEIFTRAMQEKHEKYFVVDWSSWLEETKQEENLLLSIRTNYKNGDAYQILKSSVEEYVEALYKPSSDWYVTDELDIKSLMNNLNETDYDTAYYNLYYHFLRKKYLKTSESSKMLSINSIYPSLEKDDYYKRRRTYIAKFLAIHLQMGTITKCLDFTKEYRNGFLYTDFNLILDKKYECFLRLLADGLFYLKSSQLYHQEDFEKIISLNQLLKLIDYVFNSIYRFDYTRYAPLERIKKIINCIPSEELLEWIISQQISLDRCDEKYSNYLDALDTGAWHDVKNKLDNLLFEKRKDIMLSLSKKKET